MKQDVIAYIKYYNLERFHSANGDLSPVAFEHPLLKTSSLAWVDPHNLDDGIKENYGKFGDLLAEVKAITGLNAEGI